MTSLDLTKGQRIDITKGTNITKVLICLGWNEGPYDLDASALLLTKGKFTSNDDVVYFRNLNHKSGAISHSGDNLTGAGKADTDKEIITVDLSKVPASYDRIVFPINIYMADEKRQNFGMVSNAYGRVVNASDGKEIARFNMSEDYSTYTAIIVGEVYRHEGEWKFHAIGEGKKGDLNVIVTSFS